MCRMICLIIPCAQFGNIFLVVKFLIMDKNFSEQNWGWVLLTVLLASVVVWTANFLY